MRQSFQHWKPSLKSDGWRAVPDCQDVEAYENTALLCYKVDRRITMLDVMQMQIKDDEREAFHLEQRLNGMAL